MLTLKPNTAICDISATSFITKKGKICLFSELVFIDGSSIKLYDFGELARRYQAFVIKRLINHTDGSVKE